MEALDIVPTPELNRDGEKLSALALKAALPTIGGHRESAERGLLIGYGLAFENLANKQQVMWSPFLVARKQASYRSRVHAP